MAARQTFGGRGLSHAAVRGRMLPRHAGLSLANDRFSNKMHKSRVAMRLVKARVVHILESTAHTTNRHIGSFAMSHRPRHPLKSDDKNLSHKDGNKLGRENAITSNGGFAKTASDMPSKVLGDMLPKMQGKLGNGETDDFIKKQQEREIEKTLEKIKERIRQMAKIRGNATLAFIQDISKTDPPSLTEEIILTLAVTIVSSLLGSLGGRLVLNHFVKRETEKIMAEGAKKIAIATGEAKAVETALKQGTTLVSDRQVGHIIEHVAFEKAAKDAAILEAKRRLAPTSMTVFQQLLIDETKDNIKDRAKQVATWLSNFDHDKDANIFRRFQYATEFATSDAEVELISEFIDNEDSYKENPANLVALKVYLEKLKLYNEHSAYAEQYSKLTSMWVNMVHPHTGMLVLASRVDNPTADIKLLSARIDGANHETQARLFAHNKNAKIGDLGLRVRLTSKLLGPFIATPAYYDVIGHPDEPVTSIRHSGEHIIGKRNFLLVRAVGRHGMSLSHPIPEQQPLVPELANDMEESIAAHLFLNEIYQRPVSDLIGLPSS